MAPDVCRRILGLAPVPRQLLRARCGTRQVCETVRSLSVAAQEIETRPSTREDQRDLLLVYLVVFARGTLGSYVGAIKQKVSAETHLKMISITQLSKSPERRSRDKLEAEVS